MGGGGGRGLGKHKQRRNAGAVTDEEVADPTIRARGGNRLGNGAAGARCASH